MNFLMVPDKDIISFGSSFPTNHQFKHWFSVWKVIF